MEGAPKEEEKINPSQDLKKAMEELGLDPKQQGLTREMIVKRFEEEIAKPNVEFW